MRESRARLGSRASRPSSRRWIPTPPMRMASRSSRTKAPQPSLARSTSCSGTTGSWLARAAHSRAWWAWSGAPSEWARQFPRNKVRNPNAPLDAEFGDNIKLLEEQLNRTNWKLLGRYYAIGFSVFTLSLFILLVVIRLAFHIF